MNLSTKIGSIFLAAALSLGLSTSTQAQTGPLAILGGGGAAAAAAAGILTIGFIAVESAGNDNPDQPLPRGDGLEPNGGSQSTFDTSTTGT